LAGTVIGYFRPTVKNDWMHLTYHRPDGSAVKLNGAIVDIRWPDGTTSTGHEVYVACREASYLDMGSPHKTKVLQDIPTVDITIRGLDVAVEVTSLVAIRIVKEGT
jgi:hypothetical protein